MDDDALHGGNIRAAEARYGHKQGSMIDLSTGIAPRAYPVSADDFAGDILTALPQDEDNDALVAAMRDAHGIDASAGILPTPGSEIAARLAALMIARRGGGNPVALADPVYGGHLAAWQAAGVAVLRYKAGEFAAIGKNHKGSAVVVLPGAPLGEIAATREELLAAAHNIGEHGGVLVVDEAYCDLTPEISLLPDCGEANPALMVLRSFGKFYGLGGLRLGFAVGGREAIGEMARLLGGWTVSAPALKIGARAIGDKGFANAQRAWLKTRGAAMEEVFVRHGLNRIGGTALFHLVETEEAARLHEYLAREARIWTRIYKDYPRWIRFGVPCEKGLEKLDHALGGFRRQ